MQLSLESRQEFIEQLEQHLYRMFLSLGLSETELNINKLHRIKVQEILETTNYSILEPNIYNDSNCGVYCIYNFVSKKRYIGSSIELAGRKYNHFYDLRNGVHNDRFQKAYSKYGKEAFVFFIISFSTKEKVRDLEQSFLNSQLFAQEYIRHENLKFQELGYNICPIVDSPLGFRHSEESKKHMKDIKKGKSYHSEKQMEVLRKPWSDEERVSIKRGQDEYWRKVKSGEIIRKNRNA